MNCFGQYRIDPSLTVGETIVGNVARGIYIVMAIPLIIIGGILAAPVYGLKESIDGINKCVCVPIHKRKMNKKWKYRLNRQAIRMSALHIWQRDINAYDQHMRKMLAIAELNDLPFEVWGDLLDVVYDTDFEKGRIYEIVQMFGIPELYTDDIKKEAVEIAMLHYRMLYLELHDIPKAKDAELRINDIIALELYSS